MISITKAPIVKESTIERFKNLRGVFKMPKALEPKKYGIDSILIIHKDAEKIVSAIINKLKDGFQLMDGLVAFSLISPIKSTADNWPKAKLEYGDLDPSESSALMSDLTRRAIAVGGVDLNNVGNRSINDLMIVIELIADMYDIINMKLADGFQTKDLETAPELTNIMLQIYEHLADATLDVKDLKGKEYVQVIEYLTLRIHVALSRPVVKKIA